MSHTYSPTAAPLTSLTLPDDDTDDDKDAASVNVPFEALANGVRDLQEKLDPLGASGALEEITRMAGDPTGGPNASYDWPDLGEGFPWPAVRCVDTYRFAVLLDLPEAAELRKVRAYLYEDPSTGTTTALVEICRRAYDDTEDVGEIANVPVVTTLASSTTKVALSGGVSYVEADLGMAASQVLREDAADYFVRISGTATGGAVYWLPKVRFTVGLPTVDKGAA